MRRENCIKEMIYGLKSANSRVKYLHLLQNNAIMGISHPKLNIEQVEFPASTHSTRLTSSKGSGVQVVMRD